VILDNASESRRRDEDSDWHDLVPAQCDACGCTSYVAKDDAEIIWEPGRAWDPACTDRDCTCHTDPVVGARRN